MSTARKIVKQSAAEQLPDHEGDALACLGAELLRRAEESQPALETAWDELLTTWGIKGKPVGVKRLREMIQKECRGKPEANEFSRELIALREGP